MWLSPKQYAWIDLSTYCNAACPQCHRTNPLTLEKVDWLPLIQWDLQTFKKAFPPNEIYNVYNFELCGTWGDPCMNKDIFEIIRYIIECSNATITLSTNGSMREESWWWDLAVLGRQRLKVVFTIDGIDQPLHEKYRQKTNLNKILEHMEVVIAGGARAAGFTVVFKHNEDYIDEIAKMCYDRGTDYKWISSDRWDKGNPFHFNDQQGNPAILEKATRQYKTRNLS